MKRYLKLAAALLLTAATVSCEKEKENVEYNFIATLEKVAGDSTDNRSKVMLLNEQWINWEVGDIITIGSDKTDGTTPYTAYLVRTSPGGSGDFDRDFSAAFLSTLPVDSKYFLGLFPHRSGNVIAGSEGSVNFTATINLAAKQPVRNDSTFSREVYPMVAWYGDSWDNPEDVPYNLDFHSLGGIVRLQLFNASGVNKELKEVRLVSRDSKQLVGRFSVADYKINDPHLVPADNTDENRTLTLDCGTGLEFNNNSIRTFYVILPALGGRAVSTDYALTVTVETTDGGTCTRNVTVPVRRTGITNIRALGINNWEGQVGSSVAGLVGNGTEDRPFKVYNFTDLVYLRNAYNGTRRINGQSVNRNTHVRIMRSDIEIPNNQTVWGTGIQNFCGHLTAVSGSSTPGISTNNNLVPLFESISDSGIVEGIVLKADVNYYENTAFSPFCTTNRGTIKECVLTDRTSTSMVNSNYADLAALCVDNYGTIEASRCDATLQASGHVVSSLCLNNKATGVIKECQITSPMTVRSATQVGGVCYNNQGTVKDCYYSASITQSAAAWGGIVYTNSGTVEHCANMGIITSSNSVGGVVHTLTGGTVNYCYLQGDIQGGMVGGVACEVTGGTIINSFINSQSAQIILTASTGEHGAGGITATISGGSIKNCFAYFPHIDQRDLTGHVGGILGHATGGTIDHCYTYETAMGSHYFYGVSTGATYSHCYLVNGANQNDNSIEQVTTTSSTDALEVMQGNLNIDRPTGGKEWVGASENTVPPHLQAYTPSKKSKKK